LSYAPMLGSQPVFPPCFEHKSPVAS